MRRSWCAVLAVLAMTACGGGEDGAAPAAKGDPAAPASGPCALFTQKEVEDLLGTRLGPGQLNAPMGICQWDASTDEDAIFAQIQVLDDPDYYVEQTLADGFEALSDLGERAFLVHDSGGWTAQARTAGHVIAIRLVGGKADRERTIRFLRLALERVR